MKNLLARKVKACYCVFTFPPASLYNYNSACKDILISGVLFVYHRMFVSPLLLFIDKDKHFSDTMVMLNRGNQRKEYYGYSTVYD